VSGAAYDGRAAGYDALIGSRWYNALDWGTDPADYTAFAREAVGSAEGPLLEIAAGRPSPRRPSTAKAAVRSR